MECSHVHEFNFEITKIQKKIGKMKILTTLFIFTTIQWVVKTLTSEDYYAYAKNVT